MKILWDDAKNAANRRKHGVSFEEAATLLAPHKDRLEIYDELHSTDEDRFLAIGPIRFGLAVVVYCEPRENVLRIISARRATKREAALYASWLRSGES